jgi:hypothetical protein
MILFKVHYELYATHKFSKKKYFILNITHSNLVHLNTTIYYET